jgi:type I restriction enzyme S subunit
MNWSKAPLREVCTFDRGLTYSKSDEVASGGTPVLRANNVSLATNQLDLSDIRYVSRSVSVSDAKRAKEGAILICTASGSKEHLGKVAYINDAVGWAYGGFMAQITPNSSIDGRYLYYLLVSDLFRECLKKKSDGININNLKFGDIESFEVPLPPLSEQKRIVEILDEAFDGIAKATANAQRNIVSAQDLFEGFLASFFSKKEENWKDVQLKSVCERITVGHVGSMAKRYVSSGVPFLRSQNIRPFRLDLENVIYIDQKFHSELKKSSLKAGDVAIVRTGYPGTAAVIPDDLGPANCSDLVIVRPNDMVLPDFLASFFNSSFGKASVGGRLVGAAQKHFNVSATKETILHLPPLDTQNEFTKKVERFKKEASRLEKNYLHKVAVLNELKTALLHKAFTGQLTGKEDIAA